MSPCAESRAGITPQASDPRDQFLCSLISSHHSGMRGLCQTSRASSALSYNRPGSVPDWLAGSPLSDLNMTG